MAGNHHVTFLTDALRQTEGREPPNRRASSGAGHYAGGDTDAAGYLGRPKRGGGGVHPVHPTEQHGTPAHAIHKAGYGGAGRENQHLAGPGGAAMAFVAPRSAPPASRPVPHQSLFQEDQFFHLRHSDDKSRLVVPEPPRKTPSSSVRTHARGPSGDFSGGGGGGGFGSRPGSQQSVRVDADSWVPSGYRSLGVLGSGNFSRVLRVMDSQRSEFAVKALIKRGRTEIRATLDAESEFTVGRILSSSGHPNILTYFECHKERLNSHMLVFGIRMELCSRTLGSLQPHEVRRDLITKFLVDAALGLDYMHQSGFLHIDVKPPNLLVGADGNTVKLADFGLAMPLSDISSDAIDIPEGDKLYYGNEWHGDLEHNHGNIGPASDVFSLGLSFLETSTSIRLPGRGQLYEALRTSDFGQDPMTLAPRGPISFVHSKLHPDDSDNNMGEFFGDFDELLRLMIRPLPEERITLGALLQQPLLLGHVQQSIAPRISIPQHAVAEYTAHMTQQREAAHAAAAIPIAFGSDSPQDSNQQQQGELPVLHLSQGDPLDAVFVVDPEEAAAARRVSFGSTTEDEIMGDGPDDLDEEELLGMSGFHMRHLGPLNLSVASPTYSPIVTRAPTEEPQGTLHFD
jgi:serine/threonine protein kinase